MIVTDKHIAGPNNRWCHICGRNLGKSHARDCVYLKDTPAYHIYRASERGVLAEELTVHLPPRHLPNGEWQAGYTDSQGRQNTIDLTFVEELIDGPTQVVDTGGVWYSQHPFVVLPNGEVFGPTDEDFERVAQELMADKLAPPLTKESHAQACREAMRVAEGTPVQPELFRVPPQVAEDIEQLMAGKLGEVYEPNANGDMGGTNMGMPETLAAACATIEENETAVARELTAAENHEAACQRILDATLEDMAQITRVMVEVAFPESTREEYVFSLAPRVTNIRKLPGRWEVRCRSAHGKIAETTHWPSRCGILGQGWRKWGHNPYDGMSQLDFILVIWPGGEGNLKGRPTVTMELGQLSRMPDLKETVACHNTGVSPLELYTQWFTLVLRKNQKDLEKARRVLAAADDRGDRRGDVDG